jgi:flavin-dependent dehydrogenase
MLLSQISPDQRIAYPIILGAGLTGMAISRALSAARITHVLVGDRPNEKPRLGESLNPEGSLEIVRQFPEFTRFLFDKKLLALFFGGRALAFDQIELAAAPTYYGLLGYKAAVPLYHVERIGFDLALFEAAIADDCCLYAQDRVASLDYRPGADRVACVTLAGGDSIASTYVFDATNNACFVARKLGVQRRLIGDPRRVVFAHYHHAENAQGPPPPWMQATALLRLEQRADQVDGLAWNIPLGQYVSVGVSVDPPRASADPSLLLDWVEQAYARRGVEVRRAFPRRMEAVDIRYDHYAHERCYGRNWLLAGPSCCQIWFHSAAGVGTGLVAARLAPDLLRTPQATAPVYQTYVDELTASHARLDWVVRDDPSSVSLRDLNVRARAMIGGNVARLADYLTLESTPAELASADALCRLYEGDRRLANPLRIDTAPREAQATLLFAKIGAPDPWTDPPLQVPVVMRPATLEGPAAILGLVDVLSGKVEAAKSADLISGDVKVDIDQFRLSGAAQWVAWVTYLRAAGRVSALELVPGSLAQADGQWTLTGQWRGVKAGRPSVSPQLTMTFTLADNRVTAIRTERADYTFMAGDEILPSVAFAAVLREAVARATAPATAADLFSSPEGQIANPNRAGQTAPKTSPPGIGRAY